MWTILLNWDLKDLPKKLFLLVLLTYPLFSYLALKTVGVDKKAFGLICLCFLVYRICEIYKNGSNLVIPFYIVIFGLFTGYTLLCGMFASDYFTGRGIKYFYSDTIWLTFIALIIVENTHFSTESLRFAKKNNFIYPYFSINCIHNTNF